MRLLRQIGVALLSLAVSATGAIPQGVPGQRVGNRPANDNSSFGANTAYVDGAIKTTAQRLFRFDPRVYGATCNGSGTGDDSGIASALNALKITGGGALMIPGKCVVSSPKSISGVPFRLDGNGIGVSQLTGSASFAPSGAYLLSVDITATSDLTAEIANVGFRTAQTEVAGALFITAAASGLEHRVFIHDVEMRGATVASAGFSYGMSLLNVNGPIIDRVVVTGRQSGSGQANLTNMDACYNITNTVFGLTNYEFSNVRCNAAKTAFNFNGYIEGIFCKQCIAVAVNTGLFARPGQTVPYIGLSQSHIDFFNAGVDLQYISQGSFIGNLLYHRSDATGPGVCYNIALGAGQNQIIGGECVNASTVTTSLVGVNFDNSSNNIVSDMVLSNVNSGVINQNGSTGNVYRRGQWMNVPSGAGEFGNGGSATNVCIGYGGLC